ncbi:hypothetical protein GWK47_008044 [Chionoecetes opilio]|uniref:Uncharacterized protein n=1 Tax=Chionoecetes opilio TaxID=41210 RepID=A0A8J4XYC8_CHIOP|nr:hypothetical protein GWK47_008044 [Chionoecetes opilio]
MALTTHAACQKRQTQELGHLQDAPRVDAPHLGTTVGTDVLVIPKTGNITFTAVSSATSGGPSAWQENSFSYLKASVVLWAKGNPSAPVFHSFPGGVPFFFGEGGKNRFLGNMGCLTQVQMFKFIVKHPHAQITVIARVPMLERFTVVLYDKTTSGVGE